MPRRNANTLPRKHQPRSTHLVVDSQSGHIEDHGTKRDMNALAEFMNAVVGGWRYHVKSIHK